MFLTETGGLIAAASEKSSRPLLQIGNITIVKRIVITMQQAGIFPIVIIIGTEHYDIQYEMFRYGVIFLRTEDVAAPSMMDSIRQGLDYLKDKCRRVMITPVNVPMFTPGTLIRMIQTDGEIIKPSYQGRGGHPILISQNMAGKILQRSWREGLKEVLQVYGDEIGYINVDDPGVLMNVHNEQELKDHLEQHNNSILRPHVNLTIEKEKAFFDSRVKLLLYLIADTNNVRKACTYMGLSYSKAWTMLNELEEQLGWKVVERSHGGSRGGKTRLTNRGMRLLSAYQSYEEEVTRFSQEKFIEMDVF